MATPRRSAMILCGLLFLAAVTTATAQDAPNDRVSRHYVLDQSSVKRTIGDNAPQKAFLDLFAAAGVADISRTNLFYNTRTGDLYLIANRRQLPPLEEALAPLSKAPPTVAIETVFVEFSSGVKIPLIGVPATNSATFILTERQSRKTLEALRKKLAPMF